MPGILHQGVLSLFKDDPWLAFDVLGFERPVDGTPIDRANELDVDAPRPLKVNPIYPDLVLVYRDPDNPKVGIVIGVEAQRESDPHKRWQILGYVGLLALAHRLDVHVVVVSYSRAYSRVVRSWARRWPKIEALILDADCVPLMTPEQARARPAAAVLAATLHGVRGNVDLARVVVAAIQHLPDRQREGYTTTILAALPKRQRVVLIEELPVKQRNDLWEIEKRSGTYLLGRSEGRKEGREEVRRMLTELILTVLELRGIPVTPANAARIRAEKNRRKLQRWAVAARQVGQASELLSTK